MAEADGKVILLGEHAVVYGAPAIAAGISWGASATAKASDVPRLTVGDRTAVADDATELGRAFGALMANLEAPALDVRVTLKQPAGVGLGASAAIAVATARAALDAMEFPDSDAERRARLVAAATAWERVFHGNPSGIDAAVAACGGCIYFTKAAGPEAIDVGVPLTLCIAVAGPAASTRAMVESVARLRERRPEIVDKAVDGVTSLVKNARLCIEAGDVTGLGKLLDLNQMLLSGLMVSTDDIEAACAMAREAGALGAKLTGAGGGGSVVALADRSPDEILEAWRAAGLECFATTIGATGPDAGDEGSS